MNVTNIYKPNYAEEERPRGFGSRRARIGYELGLQLIGASLWEVDSGQAAYPYHFHYADEEIVIVLEGRLTLRTPEGERGLEEGEVIRFPVGEQGAHQILNRGKTAARFLAISSHGRPDVVVFPDSDKVGMAERLPAGGGLKMFFRRGTEVTYWAGEDPPEPT